MPRVIGIDPGTVSLDLCGLDDGEVFLDRTIPTADAIGQPTLVTDLINEADRSAPLDLIAGPSGYGLPLVAARKLTVTDFQLAFLAPRDEPGGIAGLRSFVRALAEITAPVLLTPGVVHLPSVPAYRKVNRVDMGTADKVCAVVLGIHEQMVKHACEPQNTSFILLELGGAFSAAIAVDRGAIVDGVGGTAGPLGLRAAGALDGEVAYLARSVSKELLFAGGVGTIAGSREASADELAAAATPRGQLAWDAYIESSVKAVASLVASVPGVQHILLSGRVTGIASVRDELARRIRLVVPGATVHEISGFARVAKHAAQGAALLADGLAGGRAKPIVDLLGIRDACGTVLDHLYVISAASARARIGID